ncbi:MAG: hypothetical protein ACXAC5_05200 [Promethearchaeota archaeon]|jgi:hypothetical protein
MDKWIKGLYYQILKCKEDIEWLYMYKWADGDISIEVTMMKQPTGAPYTVQNAINRLMKEQADGTINNGKGWSDNA